MIQYLPMKRLVKAKKLQNPALSKSIASRKRRVSSRDGIAR